MGSDQTKKENKTEKTVCVTGAGGFIASWLVKKILSKGYIVRGAVHTNSADDERKYEHLRELEGDKERLQLMKADILDYQSLVSAVQGCDGVFHTACLLSNVPVSNYRLLDSKLKLI